MHQTLSSARRSSLVSAASLASWALKQPEQPGTRTRGPLRRALEAKQRAYQEHLRQLAQYFAEVGARAGAGDKEAARL